MKFCFFEIFDGKYMYNESDKVLWSENMSAKLFTEEIKKPNNEEHECVLLKQNLQFGSTREFFSESQSVAVQFISVLKTIPVNGRRLHG